MPHAGHNLCHANVCICVHPLLFMRCKVPHFVIFKPQSHFFLHKYCCLNKEIRTFLPVSAQNLLILHGHICLCKKRKMRVILKHVSAFHDEIQYCGHLPPLRALYGGHNRTFGNHPQDDCSGRLFLHQQVGTARTDIYYRAS